MPAKISKNNHSAPAPHPQNQVNPFLQLLSQTQKEGKTKETSPANISNEIQSYLKNYLLAVKADGCSNSTIRNYRSDINQFLSFLENPSLTELGSKPKLLAFARYQREKGLSDNTVKRKLVSVTQFKIWLKEQGILKSEIPLPADLGSKKSPQLRADVKVIAAKAAIANLPPEKKPVSAPKPAKKEKNGARKRGSRFSLVLNLLALALFLGGLAYFAYQQFGQAVISMAYPSTPTRPNRILSFQGRLTNTAQTPIAAETDLSFKLYDANTAGTELWSSNTCAITPDADGIFTANLGAGSGAGADDESCGSEIASNVFSENSNVWLEVTVGSGAEAEILDPRQPIRTVAYALNSETLQGLPVAEVATGDTILMMNTEGEVVLGSDNPAVKTSSGKSMTLEANSFTIQTQSGSDGDIIFSPDGIGNVQINSDLLLDGFLAAPGATLSANYAGGTALTLRGGPSATANIMEWQNNAGTALGVIDESGNVGIGTNNPGSKLYIEDYAPVLSISATSNSRVMTFNPSGGALDLTNGNFNINRFSNYDVSIGHDSTARLGIGVNPLSRLDVGGGVAIGSYAGVNAAPSNGMIVSGNVGIGNTSSSYKLDVSGDINTSTGTFRMAGTDYGQYFIDSAGTSGQVWNSDGTGRGAWSDLSSLSVGNADTLDTLDSLQFLRSDTSDEFSSGTLSINSAATLDVNGSLIANGSALFQNTSDSTTALQVNNAAGTSVFNVDTTNGRVGIGIAAPLSKLQVQYDDATAYSSSLTEGSGYLPASIDGAAITNNDSSIADGFASLHFRNQGSGGNTAGRIVLGNSMAGNGFFAFQLRDSSHTTSTQEIMRITSGGNVGIGSTSPGAKLHITGSADDQQLIVQGYSTQTSPLIVAQNSAGTELFRIDSDNSNTNFFAGRSVGDANNITGTGSEGLYNTGVGAFSLQNNTTGNYNNGFGAYSLNSNTIGTNNNAMGVSSLRSNTEGLYNTAVGNNALRSNTTGNRNIGIGNSSLYTNSTASDLVAIGYNALYANTTGTANLAIGNYALDTNTTGTANIAIGTNALSASVDADNNVAIGSSAMATATGGYNVAIGNSAVYKASGEYNVGIGSSALSLTTSGERNMAVGYLSLWNNTTGSRNAAIGMYSLRSNTEGSLNTAIGYNAGFSNLTGSANVFIGNEAGYSETSSNKLYIENSNNTSPLIYGEFDNDILRVNGTLQVADPSSTGYAFPSADGTSGQILSTDGSGAISWTSLSGLSVGNADTLDSLDSLQFLRSDTSDSFTSGTLAMDSGTTLDVNGNLSIADTDIALDGASTNFAATGNFSINTDDLFINKSTGDVGIGTSAPFTKLEVVDGTDGAASNILQLRSNFTSTGTGTGIRFANSTSTGATNGAGEISVVRTGVNTSDMYFKTTDITGATNTNLTIDNAGNVGIGTTSPSSKLTVAGTNAVTASKGNLYVYTTDAVAQNYGGQISLGGIWNTSDSPFAAVAGRKENGTAGSAAGYLQLSTSISAGGILTEQMRITSAGRVGIGNTSPSYKLDVAGDINTSTGTFRMAGTDYGQYFIDSAGTSGQLWSSDGTGRGAWSDLSSLSVGNADTLDSLDSLQFLRSDTSDEFSSGTLSINSAATLDVNGSLIANGSALFQNTSDSTTALQVNNAAGTSIFNIDTTNGRVGIGTSAPSNKLDVRGVTVFSEAVGGDTPDSRLAINQDGANWGIRLSRDVADGGNPSILFSDGVSNYVSLTKANNTDRLTLSGSYTVDGRNDEAQLIVQGHSTQTANLQEWQNSGGTVLAGINGSGNLGLGIATNLTSKINASNTIIDPDAHTNSYNFYHYLQANAEDNSYINRGAYFYSRTSGTYGFTNSLRAVSGEAYHAADGNLNSLYGLLFATGVSGTGNISTMRVARLNTYGAGTGVVTHSIGLSIGDMSDSGTPTNQYAINIDANTDAIGTNKYGIYLGNMSGASTSNYAIYTNAGNNMFNAGGDANTDFTIQGDTDSDLFFLDASTDTVQIGNLNINGAYTLPVADGTSGQILSTDGSGATSWTALSGLSVGNADTLDSLDSLQFLRSDTSDNYTSGTLTFDSGTTADVASGATLDVNGNLSIADTDIALDGASTNLTATGNFSINSDDFFINKSTGFMGIGTTTPGQELEVVGDIELSGSGRYIIVDGGSLNLDPSNGNVNLYDGSNAYSLHIYNGNTDAIRLVANGNSWFNSGNVGIGTTSPAAKLHIAGSADDQQLIVQGHSTQTANLQEWQNSAGNPLALIKSTGALVTSPTKPAGLESTNYIGNDMYLHVGGSTNDTSTNSALYGSVYTATDSTANFSNLNGINGRVYHRGTGTVASAFGLYFAGGPLGSGNITSFTAARLGTYGTGTGTFGTVTGLGISDIGLYNTPTTMFGIKLDNNSSTVGTSKYGLYVGNIAGAATNNYAIYTNDGTVYFGDNVGIGDSTPDHTLDVAGNIGLDAGGYINWGDTDGSTGYGLRDNAGTLEYKSSGGTWAEIGSGGGGGGETLAETLALGNSAGAYSIDMNNQLIENIGAAGTDFVTGGGLNLAGRLNLTGSADEAQLFIKANATQTAPLVLAQNSAGSELFRINAHSNGSIGIGLNAFNSNTGANNTALGTWSLYSNTSGSSNNAFGSGALYSNTTASGNNAFGTNALLSNITGASNIAVGGSALYGNVSGNYNIAVGASALLSNSTGHRNLAFGYEALQNSTVSDLVAIGYNALTANTTGVHNLAIGSYTLDANTEGAGNIAIGQASLTTNITGNYNTSIGTSALFLNTSSYNDAIGASALSANTTGSYNTAIGSSALLANQTGSENLAIGRLALGSLVSGTGNTAIGKQALFSGVSTVGNVGIGYKAGYSNTGGAGVFIGTNAGYYETAANKLYIANSDTTNPLIYGEFDNSLLKINGRLKALLDTSNSLDFEVGNTLATDTYSLGTSSTTSNRGLTLASLEGTYRQSLVFSDSLDADDTVFGISTSSDSGSTWNPALVVTQNGRVGIGTNAPSSALSIAGSSSIISNESGDITIDAASEKVSFNSGSLTNFNQASGSSGTVAKPTFSFSTDTDTGIYNVDTNAIGFSVNATEAMRIIANGNIGIGVTNPTEVLEVDGSINADKYYDFTNKNYFLDAAAVGTALKLAGNIDLDGDLYVGGGEIFLTPLSSSTSTTEGTIYYDSDTDHIYLRDGSSWRRLAMDMTKYTDSDTSLANGSYLEITHNQASNDLTALGWVYDSANSVWKAVSDYSHTVWQNLQNQWNDATGQNSFINTESRLTNVELSAGVNVGTGADGDITVSSNSNINTATLIAGRSCADAVNYNVSSFNTAGTQATLSTTPSTGCLNVGDEVLIINLQGTSGAYTNTGNWETLYVQDVSGTTVTFSQAKTKYYGANATDDTNLGTSTSTQRVMLQRVPHYNDVTINSGVNFYPADWNGAKGGVMFFRANGTVNVNGTLHAYGSGYRGGTGGPGGQYGYQGESLYYSHLQTLNAVVSGGGAGQYGNSSTYEGGGGGGGSYSTAGSNGIRFSGGGYGGYGATTLLGDTDLSKLLMGGAGGGGGGDRAGFSAVGGVGGDGGGIIVIAADTINVGGSAYITASAAPGGSRSASYAGGGGGGAGGSILIQGKTISLDYGRVISNGAGGGTGTNGTNGGAGGYGRIAIYYADSITGTTTPTYDSNYLNYRNYGLYHSPILQTPNAIDYSNLRWEEALNGYGNIELQTRTGSASEMSADANTVGLWHLNEDSGTSVADASTSNNPGTASGAPITDKGIFGNARIFDGISDYINITDANSLDLTSAVTLEAWIKPYDLDGLQSIIVKRDASAGEYNYALRLNDGKLEFYYLDSSTTLHVAGTNTNIAVANTWQHVAVTYDSSDVKFYLNGIFQASTCTTGTCNTAMATDDNSLAIGRAGDADAQYFTGEIDEVRISNTARSAAAIAANAIQWEAWSPNANTSTCASPNCTSLETEASNYYTNWTASGATVAVGDITRSAAQFEDDHQATATNLTKITSSTSGDYIEDTITNVDLSAYDYLTFWVRASQPGNTLKVGIGEAAATENEENITINEANTWQKIYWDLSDIADPNRDAITKIRLSNLVSASNTIYLGYIHAEKQLTNASGSKITSTPNDLFQYRIIFSTTNGAYQPQLENIAFTYNDGYKIEQADNNTVRLYNYTGEAQNLRLDVTVFGADLAEWYTVEDDSIGPGDLVSITGEMDEYGVPILKKTSKANDPMLIGAISTQAGTELGLPADNRRLLGLDGRIPVKMDPRSPDLEKGDHLTSSDLPGYARKAKPGELSIGRSFQNWKAENEQKTVLIIINDVMTTPSFGEKMITSLLDLSEIAKYQIGEGWSLINSSTGETVDSAIALAQAVIGKLRVGRLEVDEIAAPEGENLAIKGNEIAFELGTDQTATQSALGKLLINNRAGETVISLDEAGNASFSGELSAASASISGELYADKISTNNIEADVINGLQERLEKAVADRLEEPSLIASLFGEMSQQTDEYLEELKNEADNAATNSLSEIENNSNAVDGVLLADDGFIANYFEVNGSAYIGQSLAVEQNLMIGSGMTLGEGYLAYQPEISEGEFDSSFTFAIQPSGKGRLSLMANLMTLDESGLVTINGDLKVAGALDVNENLRVKGTLLTNIIKAENLDENIQIQLAQIASGSAEVKHNNLELLDETGSPVATFSAQGELTLSGALSVDQGSQRATDSAAPNNRSTGQASIAAGQSEVVIKTARLNENSMIYITPLNSTSNQVLYVKDKLLDSSFTNENEAQFTVGFDHALDREVKFNWWIVN